MRDTANPHWTEDDDLLAQYVLGRLSTEERKQLDDHLLSCSQCREEVEKEQVLVSGIRQYGRQEVKSQLKQQLALRPDSHRRLVTWQRIASVAAVVVIITGVGIYNRWFTWTEQKNFPAMQEIHDSSKASSSRDVSADESRGKATPTANQEAAKESLRDHDGIQKARTEQTQGVQTEDEGPKIQPELNDGMNKMENVSAAPSTGGGAIPMKKDLGNVKGQMVREEQPVKQFWVEGKILPELHTGTKGYSAMEGVKAPEKNMPKSKQSRESIRRQPMLEGNVNESGVRISQRSANLLPLARQKLQQENEQNIQIHVQQSDHRTTLTMYLDTLFNEADLQNARVEEIQPDSIVIGLESRSIGFKLPFNIFNLQKGTQKAKLR
jgi:hypothetical protein